MRGSYRRHRREALALLFDRVLLWVAFTAFILACLWYRLWHLDAE